MYNCPVPWYTVVDEMSVDELSWNPQKECSRVKEQLFKSDLDELFDVSTKDALATMSNEEDKQFLLMTQVWPALTNPLLIKRLAGTVGLHRRRLVGKHLTSLHSKPLLQQYTSTRCN